MARDFSNTVAGLLGNGTVELEPLPVPQMDSETALALAREGHAEAQAVLAGLHMANINIAEAANPNLPEWAGCAIHWARESDLGGSVVGTRRLVEALFDRASLLSGMGFKEPAERDAEEAMGLLLNR